MPTISRNIEKEGIELSFPTKPADEILIWIKEQGFGWSKYHKVWWIKFNEKLWEKVHAYFDQPLTEESDKPSTMKEATEGPLSKEGEVIGIGDYLYYGGDPRKQGFQLQLADMFKVKGFRNDAGVDYPVFDYPEGRFKKGSTQSVYPAHEYSIIHDADVLLNPPPVDTTKPFTFDDEPEVIYESAIKNIEADQAIQEVEQEIKDETKDFIKDHIIMVTVPKYEPGYDEQYLNEQIEKATPNLSKIKDIDAALAEIRGEEPELRKEFLREKDGFKIYLVDGEAVRKDHITFTMGGHGYVYDYIPKNEIWIDENLKDKPADMEATIRHELFEIKKMRDEGLSYEEAHELANAMEKEVRNEPEQQNDWIDSFTWRYEEVKGDFTNYLTDKKPTHDSITNIAHPFSIWQISKYDSGEEFDMLLISFESLDEAKLWMQYYREREVNGNKDAKRPTVFKYGEKYNGLAESTTQIMIKKGDVDKDLIPVIAEIIKNDKPASFNLSDYKTDFEKNKAIEKLLDEHPVNDSFFDDKHEFLKGYSGYGGLDDDAIKSGIKLDTGSLYEFYTPDLVIEKMWGLAHKHGYNEGRLCEPSSGIGSFLDRKYVKSSVIKDAYEVNKYSAKIVKILYPETNVNDGAETKYFEQLFIKNNYTVRGNISPVHDLVIGNPPYGEALGLYMGMGEKTYTHAKNYIDYFIFRGLDLLKKDGLLIYIIGAEVAAGGHPWLDQGTSKCKEFIAAKGKLIDAYRLPEGLFARTNVVTDIIVLKRR